MNYEGVVVNAQEDVAEFIINEAYPISTLPVICVLSGSAGYGLNLEDSDEDYIGIHFMDTHEILEHPKYRQTPQVIRKCYKDFEEVAPGTKGSQFSLDSFEMWKFYDLLIKSSFVAYEILYMPAIHELENSEHIVYFGRQMLTSKIGKVAKGVILHDWRRQKTNRKKTIMAYYRVLQAIYYLKDLEFEWNAEYLWNMASNDGLIVAGKDILDAYMIKELRHTQLTGCELDAATIELNLLINEVEKAMAFSKLDPECPRSASKEFLGHIRKSRAAMI